MTLQSGLAPFSAGSSASLPVTGASANVALPGIGPTKQVMVNSPAANAVAFIKFGADNTVQAALTDIPILPGTVQVLTPPPNATYAAAIGTAGTLYFTVGIGQ